MYPLFHKDPSREEVWFEHMFNIAQSAAKAGKWELARNASIYWSDEVCNNVGLSRNTNWKFFKRSLVAKWFGKPENRKFHSGWNVDDALQYANRFQDRAVRFSLFPKDIACHAVSYRLAQDDKKSWHNILLSVDNSVDMEMFPEASTSTSICFRRYSSFLSDVVEFEAGKGQAMFVFEQERGKHSTVVAIKDKTGNVFEFQTINKNPDQSTTEIGQTLKSLILSHEQNISGRCFGICRKLGIDYVSTEGYYDPLFPDRFLIVDIDLPFDVFFMPAKDRVGSTC